MEEKIRGRKRIEDGGKKTPREIFVVCIAHELDEAELIKCENSTKDSLRDEIIEEAKEIFKSRHGCGANEFFGPFYEWKGTQSYSVKTAKEEIDPSDWEYIPGKKATALYKDWQVTVRYFQDHEDIGFVYFNQPLLSNKKTKPAAKAVYLSELKNLTLIENNNEQK